MAPDTEEAKADEPEAAPDAEEASEEESSDETGEEVRDWRKKKRSVLC